MQNAICAKREFVLRGYFEKGKVNLTFLLFSPLTMSSDCVLGENHPLKNPPKADHGNRR